MEDFNKILDQAKELESKIKESQEKIKKIEAEGISGSNSIKVTLNGDGDITKIELSTEVLNEEKSIQSLYQKIKFELSDLSSEIIFVNDGSSDRTCELISEIINQDSNIPLFVAHKWETTHNEDFTTFSIEEDFTNLVNFVAEASNTDGKGVYTVLVWALPEGSNNGMVLTTISIFFL